MVKTKDNKTISDLSSLTSEELLAIETTVMGIREELMQYFKGTCIDRVTTSRNIRRVPVGRARGGYYYQRRQADNEKAEVLLIDNVPIATLRMAPERIVFHRATLGRSKQLRKVHDMLEEFMKDFLAGVTKEYNDAHILFK